MSRPRLYVVDGHNHIFRAFYAIRGMTRADGQATNAIYGFTSTLRKLIADERPDLLAVTFDTAAGSFRSELYDAYKANRGAPPEDLVPQFSIIRDVVKAYNIAAMELPGWEADDIMATLAVQGEAAGFDVTIVSTDKDLCQLVTDHVQLLNPMKNLRLGTEEVVAKMGVPPKQVTDLQGLCGDSSDNIPGVPGIGMKTAAKLIDSYGTIEGIYEAIDAGDKGIKGKRLENLINHKDDAFLSRELATLALDVPIEASFGVGGAAGWDKLKIGEPDVEALRALFEENQLRRFLAELPAREGEVEETSAVESSTVAPLSQEDYVCVTSTRQLAEMCAELAASGGFAFDTETTGLDPWTDQLVGMSFAADRRHCWYVPLRHEHLGHSEGAQLELGGGWRRDASQLPVDAVLSAVAPARQNCAPERPPCALPIAAHSSRIERGRMAAGPPSGENAISRTPRRSCSARTKAWGMRMASVYWT